MEKAFVTVLPDEPYKTTTKLNKTVNCVYDGPRYLLLKFNDKDGTLFCVERALESLEDLETFKYNEEGFFQVVLDADVNTWEAAYLTRNYTHDEVVDHEETLPTGEKWIYHYDDYKSAVNQPFYVNDLKYNNATKTYIRPRYRVHAVATSDFLASVEANLSTFERACLDNRYSADKMAKIVAHRDFLKSITTRYAGVDHWKITFPPQPSLDLT